MSADAPADLVKAPASRLAARGATADEVRARLEQARHKVSAQLDALELTLSPALRVRAAVRNAVRRHPVLTLGGALLAGYGLARLLSRR
ncbi:MAG: hypothetical protein IT380_27640 [Myxococcales bacterium]|nr:hypothetical protein [Myxococcales bacterium]